MGGVQFHHIKKLLRQLGAFIRLNRHQFPNRLSCSIILAASFALLHAAFADPPPPPTEPGIFLNAWHFNDTNFLSFWGNPPMAATGLSLAPSWEVNAVMIVATNALLQYREIETNGITTNIVCQNGTIYLWFKPVWDSASIGGAGPGTYGRLIEMGSYTTNASIGWWSLYLGPWGTNLYFGGQTNGAGSTFLSSSVTLTSNNWTFLALTYSPSNSFLYTNGILCSTGSGSAYFPGPDVRASNGFCLGGSLGSVNLALGRFEWIRTYNYPLSAAWVSNYYQTVLQTYGGGVGPLGPNGPNGPLGPTGGPRLVAAPQGTNLLLTITQGTDGIPYDFFRTTNLLGNNITNGAWTWLGKGSNGFTYLFSSQPRPNAWYVLGTPLDSDGDGLTDAYEQLITHTDPYPPFKVFITQPDPQALLP